MLVAKVIRLWAKDEGKACCWRGVAMPGEGDEVALPCGGDVIAQGKPADGVCVRRGIWEGFTNPRIIDDDTCIPGGHARLLGIPLRRRNEREVRKAKVRHRPRHHPNIPRIPRLNEDDTCGSLHGCLASSIGWMGGYLDVYRVRQFFSVAAYAT